MIDTVALREKVLDLAIRGKLVPQDPNDEPASVLLERIRAQKQQMVKEGKLKAKDIKDDSIIFVGEDNLHYEKFADGTVECIEDQIPFELPNGWAWSKINNIAFVTKLAGFEYSKYIAPTLCEDGIPLFKGKNVQDSKIIYEFESFIPESISDELSRSQITRKCILTPYVGTIGNIGIHDKVGKFHLGSNVGKIELYNSCVVLMEEYVVTYLKSSFGYKQLTKHMKATAQASISIEAIRDVYIPIPPKNEQQRMWSAISESLTLIENIESYECDIADMVKLAKARILDLSIRGKLVPQNPDDEPASVLLERIRAEKEELIRQGKIKRDKKESVIFKGEDNSYYVRAGDQIEDICAWELDDLPESWGLCTLGEISDYGSCTNVETDQISDDEWILDLEDIEKDNGRVLCKIRKHERNAVSTKHKFYEGQVLYSKLRPYLNKVVLADENGYCTSEILPLDFSEIIVPSYARYYLMSQTFLKYADRCSYGVKMPRLSTADGKKAVFTIPPIDEQNRIVGAIETAFAQLDSIAESLN